MPTYLYCLIFPASAGDLANAAPEGVRGIDGAPVRSLPTGAGALWTSSLPATPPATVERALAHDAVCDAALALGGTVLPVRFGTVFPTDAALAASIESRRDALARTAERIGTAVEMTIAVAAPVAPPAESRGTADPASPGHAYMARLAAPSRAARAVLDAAAPILQQIREMVGAYALAESVRVAVAPPATVIVSHLIERSNVAQYRAAAATAGGGAGRPLVGGPSAPYSFVALDGSGAERDGDERDRGQ